jgi:predicted phage tail protein
MCGLFYCPDSTMTQLRTIRLYGQLGAKFGRVYRFALDSNTPAEAMAALRAQVPGLTAYLANAKSQGVTFAVFAGKRNLTAEQLSEPSGSDDIRIAPVLIGSKNGGIFQTILGAVLVVVGAYFHITPLVSVGISLMAGGVAQLLSPQPKGVKGGSATNQPSYVFNGAVNTQAQGNPVPYLFGRMIVGSAVASAGIHAEDYAPATAGVGPGVANGSNVKNFYQRA